MVWIYIFWFNLSSMPGITLNFCIFVFTSFGFPMSRPFRSTSGSKYSSAVMFEGLLPAFAKSSCLDLKFQRNREPSVKRISWQFFRLKKNNNKSAGFQKAFSFFFTPTDHCYVSLRTVPSRTRRIHMNENERQKERTFGFIDSPLWFY